MAPSSARSPLTGTHLEGMEHLFGSIIIDTGERVAIYRNLPKIGLFESIPKRVLCSVPLEVKNQSLFVMEKVAAGDLIFKIERPLLNIVNSGKGGLANTCDNCMATCAEPYPGVKLITVPIPDLTFSTCGGCRLLYYCNKACQKAAWKHHHKYECQLLHFLKNSPCKTPDGISLVYTQEVRSLIRLLILHENDMIPKDEWTEFLAIPNHKEQKMKQDRMKRSMETFIEIYENLIDLEIHPDVLVGLVCSMYQNTQKILVPILKGAARSYDPHVSSTITYAGNVFEPVVNLLKHSCDPNVWVVFEGHEMGLRALKDIPAGTQLVRSCIRGEIGEYAARKTMLKTMFNVDCDCHICQRGEFGPTGSLLNRLRNYADGELIDMRSTTRQKAVERAIKDMQEAGFGYETAPMRSLHQLALKGHIIKFKTAEALKNCLKIYYLIEPVQVPAVLPSDRINTLFNLVSLLDIKIQASSDHMKACESLPQEVQKLLPVILFPLKAKVHQETAKWFGADSMAAKFEKHMFEDLLAKLKTMAEMGFGAAFEYVPLEKSAKKRREFVKAMNELLQWAGVPALEAKDLL